MEEYTIKRSGGLVTFPCPHCGESVDLVVKQEELGNRRELNPMTGADVEQIQQMRRES